MSTTANPFWQKHPGLVWSNRDAGDSVHIRAALLRPRFSQLLAIAGEFGAVRLRQEWNALQADESREVERARSSVERVLDNIEKGFALAATRD